MENEKKGFTGIWIPKVIWENKDLGWTEKLLLVEIEALDNEKGCYAKNEYFSNFFGLSKDRISKLITNLKRMGYIEVELFYKKGTKQIESRKINVNTLKYHGKEGRRKNLEGIGENNDTPIGENAIDNNIINNNKNNNTTSTQKNELEDNMKLVFDYWNTMGIVKHTVFSKTAKKEIKARINDGYQFEQLTQAIRNFKEVLDNPKYMWTKKYTLAELMRDKDLSRFIDEAEPFNKFINYAYQKPTQQQVVSQPPQKIFDPSQLFVD